MLSNFSFSTRFVYRFKLWERDKTLNFTVFSVLLEFPGKRLEAPIKKSFCFLTRLAPNGSEELFPEFILHSLSKLSPSIL